jgi:NAD(P)-dependent dehydrogenase (short-subunit alcohol dehydrogenase family)
MKPFALVTGGARGIGLGISKALVKSGYNLIISALASKSQRSKELKSLNGPERQIVYIQADIAKEDDRQRIIDEAKKRAGCLNLLVNNAGIAPNERTDILESSLESFDQVLGVNLKGAHFLTQLAARWMIQQKQASQSYQGCVINIGSVSARMVSPNRAEYCISKAGLWMSTQAWAARLAEFDLPVYEIRPGIIRSDMTDSVQDKYNDLIDSGGIPQARWGVPEDVGSAVVALARGDFPYSTGSVINVDGGLSIHQL